MFVIFLLGLLMRTQFKIKFKFIARIVFYANLQIQTYFTLHKDFKYNNKKKFGILVNNN